MDCFKSIVLRILVQTIWNYAWNPIEDREHFAVAFRSAWSFKIHQGRTSMLVAAFTFFCIIRYYVY